MNSVFVVIPASGDCGATQVADSSENQECQEVSLDQYNLLPSYTPFQEAYRAQPRCMQMTKRCSSQSQASKMLNTFKKTWSSQKAGQQNSNFHFAILNVVIYNRNTNPREFHLILEDVNK